MIKLLKDVGARNIGIGIEHGNENFRKKVLKRNISNQQIVELFALCDKYNLSHNDFIMVGFPFENTKLFFDTVRLCRKVGAQGQISIFHPYPGTELGKICEENNWLPEKEVFRERQESLIDFPNFSKEEIQTCAQLFSPLVKWKIIPLWLPLKWIWNFCRILQMIK